MLGTGTTGKDTKKTAVGSLIVCNNEIISEGLEGSPELPSLLAHAEAIAIVKAIEFRYKELIRMYPLHNS